MKHLSGAFKGRNNWWRYLLLFLVSLFGGQLIGAIPLAIVMVYKFFESGGALQLNPENPTDLSSLGIGQNSGLFLLIFPFITSLFTMILLFKPLHGRNFKSLLSGIQKIRWSRFFLPAAIWASIFLIYLFIDYLTNRQAYVLNFRAGRFIVLCILSLSMIPFQSSYEEIMFRGYIAQGIGVWAKNRILVIIVPAVLFGLMHAFNPEIDAFGFWIAMPQYIFFGLIFGLFTVLDDGIEVAMGVHSANNVFMSIFVTSPYSAFQTPALFFQGDVDPIKDMVVLFAAGILITAILAYLYKWDFKILKQKIEPTREILPETIEPQIND
jgi:membrane protease YdiL (CAAX protease family)